MKSPRIYLASASPRRHELLLQMGIPHEILAVPAPEGEDEPRLPGEAPEIYVQRTAREKAERARHWVRKQERAIQAGNLSSAIPILSADTTVILDDEIMGKPGSTNEARFMLQRLSGRMHVVHTAIAVAHGSALLEDVSVTEVRFKSLTAAEIDAYCDSGEPMGKAGAYGIQGKAGRFVVHISGSYTGVMGLPVYETGLLLDQL